MVTLENEYLRVQINELGAELSSVVSLDTNLEYMWQADKQIWGRHAPVLFPIVGRLKDDQYEYQGTKYEMHQHGFARDEEFEVVDSSDTHATLKLTDNNKTHKIYPFEFELVISFDLKNHELRETYRIYNPDADKHLLFSIGGHPGFNTNFGSDQIFEDGNLHIAPNKTYSQIPLKVPLNDAENAFPVDFSKATRLNHDLFKKDAIILELNKQETTIMLDNQKNDHGVALTVIDAPYVGIWSPYPNTGNFVCIEPWWGIADNVNSTGKLEEKMGINDLDPKSEASQSFEISFF
ncbi:aldose 1-epimerase family protein [Pediococcus damnosus]|uniref:LacX protein, plasmid n=1 Tax=Pediococcus damnosus TaxID=51663 RepID=A0AAC9B0H0_9LACO|nr:aldose 1-epimerase family protein [Pediococcus damnosus]AMV62104.1 LacX protein, plasmid [Pediococcus damnosus]